MSKPDSHSQLDKTQFEQLFKAHFVHLSNFAMQYVKDLDTAKDITQKVFIHLWEHREKIDTQKSIPSYLFTSVKNRCLNFIRDHKKYRSQVLDLELESLELPFDPDGFALEELQDRIEEALNKLPEKCRLVFKMSRYEHKKYREIAEELDLSVKTVEAHMARALKGLKNDLKEYIHLLWILIGYF